MMILPQTNNLKSNVGMGGYGVVWCGVVWWGGEGWWGLDEFGCAWGFLFEYLRYLSYHVSRARVVSVAAP